MRLQLRSALPLSLALGASALALAACSSDDKSTGGNNKNPFASLPGAALVDVDFVDDKCDIAIEADVYIGGIMPFTGDWPVGKGFDWGAQLAIREINAHGGINASGDPVGYISCNTESDQTVGTSLAKELSKFENLGALIGPGRSVVAVGSGTDSAAAQAAIDAGTLMVSPSATSPRLSTLDDNGFVFRTTVSDAVQGKVLAKIAEREGFQRIFVMQTQGDAYAIGLREQFMSTIAETAGQEAQFSAFQFSDTDFATGVLDAAKAAWASEGKLPDAILLSMLSEQAQTILSKAKTYTWGGNAPVWMGPDGVKSSEVIDDLAAVQAQSAVFGTNPGTPSGEAYTKFAAAYKALWGEDPGQFSSHAYDAAYLIAGAMVLSTDPSSGTELKTNIWKATGRTDVEGDYGDTFGPDQWAAMKAALVAAGQVNYEGASGAVDFDLNGDVLSNIEEWTIATSGSTKNFTTTHCWTADGSSCD